MDSGSRLRRSEQVAFRQIGDECLLVPIRTSPEQGMAIFSLNPVGAFIWTALESPLSPAELVERVVREFEVDAQQAQADVARFLSLLQARSLVEQLEN